MRSPIACTVVGAYLTGLIHAWIADQEIPKRGRKSGGAIWKPSSRNFVACGVIDASLQVLNSSLRKTLQMDDLQIIMTMDLNRKLKGRTLKQRLRGARTDLGFPEAQNLITQTISVEDVRKLL
jgi:hypothetical protein